MAEGMEWGISIEHNVPNEKMPVPTIKFQFKFAQGNPHNKFFYSNEKLAEIIKGCPVIQNKGLGFIEYSLHHYKREVKREVHLDRYYPFDDINYFSFLRGPSYGELVETITGKGVASLLERKCIRHLVKQYPGFIYQEPGGPALGRRTQLKKRGMHPGQRMPLEEFLRILQQTTREWKREKKRLEKKPRRWKRVRRTAKKVWQAMRRR